MNDMPVKVSMRLMRLFLAGLLGVLVLMLALDHHAAVMQDAPPEEDCPALVFTPVAHEDALGPLDLTAPTLAASDSASSCLDDATPESAAAGESTPEALPGWTLLWSDEFDGPAGAPINLDYWTCETGGHGWGNKELEYYTDSLENAALDGHGFLQITAQPGSPESGKTCWYGQCAYTSARCITQGKVEFTYGRVEARLKIPFGQGLWPAFWMLGGNFNRVGWPTSGEIGIMENIGSEPQTVHGTIHGPGYSGAGGIGHSYSLDADFADDFNVFAIEWEPDVIRWYVDGVLYSTISADEIGNHRWVYDHDFFILMNVAVGGSWPGYPDESTRFPQQMLVDYVRVYQPTP